MTIYIDKDFKCHVSEVPGASSVETSFFDGKSAAFVEGYRFIPHGQTWVGDDGKIFEGEIASPWKPYSELDAAQREYEREQADDMEAALAILGVTVDG